jgi:hypothetical protein
LAELIDTYITNIKSIEDQKGYPTESPGMEIDNSKEVKCYSCGAVVPVDETSSLKGVAQCSFCGSEIALSPHMRNKYISPTRKLLPESQKQFKSRKYGPFGAKSRLYIKEDILIIEREPLGWDSVSTPLIFKSIIAIIFLPIIGYLIGNLESPHGILFAIIAALCGIFYIIIAFDRARIKACEYGRIIVNTDQFHFIRQIGLSINDKCYKTQDIQHAEVLKVFNSKILALVMGKKTIWLDFVENMNEKEWLAKEINMFLDKIRSV